MVSIQNIRGSDGTGSASRATVTASRAPGNPTITVDTLAGWSSQFIAATGTPDLVTGLISGPTLQIFYGHESDGKIIIDSMAPGYTDLGNAIGDIVIVKPTTAWANEIADVLSVSHKDGGTIKQLDGNAPGLIFSTASTQPGPDPDNIIVWLEPLE